MIRTSVESNSIKSAGYEADSETLQLEFNSGAIYEYAGVSQYTYDQFMASSSKGYFLQANIAPCFEYHRLHDNGCPRRCSPADCKCWCHKVRRDVSKEKVFTDEEKTEINKAVGKELGKVKRKRGRPVAI